jgi:hypothetical protein
MSKSKSSFAGFVDGYKSRNIATIEGVVNNKIEEIIDFLTSLADAQNNPPNFNQILNRNINLLKKIGQSDMIDSLVSFGESLKSSVELINNATNGSPEKEEKMRKVIYDFGEIAKMTEDNGLIDLAIFLASNFKY